MSVPEEFLLGESYPNPSSGEVLIPYELPKRSIVIIVVYDALGRRVSTIENDYKNAGQYAAHWDAQGIPSGLYFYAMTTSHERQIKPLVISH